jgi:hypothetical protein
MQTPKVSSSDVAMVNGRNLILLFGDYGLVTHHNDKDFYAVGFVYYRLSPDEIRNRKLKRVITISNSVLREYDCQFVFTRILFPA